MKTIVITGGLGYIGGHLSRYLHERGYNIVVVDNMSTGYIENGLDGAILLGYDYDHEKVFEYLQENKKDIECVVHLAATLGYENENNPVYMYRNNVLRFGTLIKFLTAVDIPLVNISTAGIQLNEQVTNYGTSKLLGELLLQSSNINYITLRLFNVYGRRWNVKRRTLSAIESLATTHKGIVYGDGRTTRDYIHVLDVCKAIEKSIVVLQQRKYTMVIEVGTGVETSYIDLFHLIEKMKGVQFEVEHRDPKVEIQQSKADMLFMWSFLDRTFRPLPIQQQITQEDITW